MKIRMLAAGLGLAAAAGGCYSMRGPSGGGQTAVDPPREVNAGDVALPPGYRIEAVAQGLTFPSGVAIDDGGRVYVTEAGYSYGEVWATPRLVRLDGGRAVEVARGGKNGPWNGVSSGDGVFYVAEGGELEGGRILRITPDGSMTTLVEGLPSMGDHHTNGPVVGPDGWVYFGQGTATNSAVVGTDNAEFGWLPRKPDFHDVPCEDVTLTGRNFETENPLTPDPQDKAVTGAFSAFNSRTTPGQVIEGRVPCNGAILKVPAGGGSPEVVAWGLRNPFGLAFSADGQLYVTDNSYDERGSRPVWGTGDLLVAVKPGAWYGWPDFHGDHALAEERFDPPGDKPQPEPLLQKNPGTPPKPAAILGVHASADGLDISRSGRFGHVGEAFIALFGDMAPGSGKVLGPVGFKVVRVNPKNGVVEDFAVNRGGTNGPASRVGGGGLERPVAARFSPDGESLYVVDFGIMTMSEKGPHPQKGTGVVWRISRGGQ